MNLKSGRFIHFFILLFLIPVPVYAYLDPGTGSMLLYAIIGIAVALLYSIKGLLYKFTVFVRGRGQSTSSMNIEADIIFHSEGVQYDHLFLPLLECIKSATGKTDDSTRRIVYITQYQRDGLTEIPQSITHITISNTASGFSLLNRVKAQLFVTTTPQLGVMMFKRSKRVRHYCHIVHAPTDIGFYKPYAFDHFDSVMCPGPFMEKSLRHLEQIRNIPPKKLFQTGVVYYDAMKNNYIKSTVSNENKTRVLVAPSWGENSLFARFGTDFLSELADIYRVTVRPHPQMKISQNKIFCKLESVCREYGFYLDQSASGADAMINSDIMISDFSGIIFDYAFVYEKPLIVAAEELQTLGFEANFLPKPLWDEVILKRLARILRNNELNQLPDIIEEQLNSTQKTAKIRDETISHFGSAVPAAAGHIIGLLKELESA